jgi:hypothetical protein
MPFYRFTIHGDGKLLNDVAGFYTTRWCWGRNQEIAAAKALKIIRKDIETRRLGTIASLEVEEGWRITPFDIP